MQKEKRALRKAMLERLRALPQEQIRTWSEEIAYRVCQMEAFQQAETICVFISMPGEVDTRPIIETARAAGKKMAAPKIQDGRMEFIQFAGESDLAPGAFGILEPTGSRFAEGKTLIVMPGVVFDQTCRRIGYGGGYYDRYLAQHPQLATVAVAFDLQVLDQIPEEAHDLKPQIVVTEQRIVRRNL